MRSTRQKQILKDEINKIDNFFSADELHNKVIKIDSNIGIATVYRFLKDMKNKGNLFSYICNRKTVYSKNESHCHYINQDTGEVIHFSVENIDFLRDKIPGNITSFQIEVRGNNNKKL